MRDHRKAARRRRANLARSIVLVGLLGGLGAVASTDAGAGGLLDPTLPQPARPAAPSGGVAASAAARVRAAPLRVQGIWTRKHDRVAMLNGVRVRAGDRVEIGRAHV